MDRNRRVGMDGVEAGALGKGCVLFGVAFRGVLVFFHMSLSQSGQQREAENVKSSIV